VHGNVCLASVLVTETLDWRLHAFDVMSEFSETSPPEMLVSHSFMLADQYKPEEVRKANWELLRQAPPW
jgi:SCY1-like protein 1